MTLILRRSDSLLPARISKFRGDLYDISQVIDSKLGKNLPPGICIKFMETWGLPWRLKIYLMWVSMEIKETRANAGLPISTMQ